MRVSMGECAENCRGARTSRPPISIACSPPRFARIAASARSKPSCSAGGGSNIVE
jgi:hypothetical protein